MIFFCYLRGEPNAKTSYLHCSSVLCGKMQTVFSVQRHKKARTLSLVFCLTEPFSSPVTPNPSPHVFILQFTVPSTNGPLCVRKYTRSQKRWCLTCFGNFRFSTLGSLMTGQIPIPRKMLSLKIQGMRRLSYLFLSLCTTSQLPPSYLVKTMGQSQSMNWRFVSINPLKQEKVITRQALFPRLKLWWGLGSKANAFIHILNERRDQ